MHKCEKLKKKKPKVQNPAGPYAYQLYDWYIFFYANAMLQYKNDARVRCRHIAHTNLLLRPIDKDSLDVSTTKCNGNVRFINKTVRN